MRWMWVLAAAALFTAGCEKKQAVVREKTTRVHVRKLEKRIFQQRIPLQGTVQSVEFATISAKISGTLELLNVDEGDVVKKDDILFEIDRKVLENQVEVKKDEIKVREAALRHSKISLTIAKNSLTIAENSLKTAEISFDQAKRDYERADRLAKSKTISESSMEAAETDFQKAKVAVDAANAEIATANAEIATANANIANAEAQLKQARSNLAIAEKNLKDSRIAAPFDCVVFEKFVEKNEFVSVGKPILKLENPKALEVVCYISAVYYNQIAVGKTKVNITDKSGKNQVSKITYKAPGIDPDSRTFKIKIAVPEQSDLVSGMLCELDIILTEREGYGLPESAVLLRAEDKTIAYTITAEKRAKSVEVKRGIADGGYCEILNAKDYLAERFVVAGQTFINDNSLLTEASTENKNVAE